MQVSSFRLMSNAVALLIVVLCYIPVDVNALPNILWVIADDMTPYMKHFVSNDHPIANLTVNLEKLQNGGVTFTNAHTTQSTCGPSRAAFLTGRSPDNLKIWNFDRYIPETHPDIVTIPKYFKQEMGYSVQAFGKVFHPHELDISGSPNPDVYATLGHYDEPVMADDDYANAECRLSGNPRLYCWNTNRAYTDLNIANAFDAWVKEKSALSKPWMAILGLRRPHSDFSSPEDTYRAVNTKLVRLGMEKMNLGMDSIENVTNVEHALSRYTCVKMNDKTVQIGSARINTADGFSKVQDVNLLVSSEYEETLMAIRRAYFASILYVDEIVGKIMDSLTSLGSDVADNTIIIFSSDHGLQNGEKGMFCKNTLYETSTRVPLVILGPQVPKGFVHQGPVSLLDIFPTLLDLVGGPSIPSRHVMQLDTTLDRDGGHTLQDVTTAASGLPLDGISLVPMLAQLGGAVAQTVPSLGTVAPEPFAPHHRAATYTVYPRCACSDSDNGQTCGGLSTVQSHPCTTKQAGQPFTEQDCERPKIEYMGYTLRTERHRYIEWRVFQEVSLDCEAPSWPGMPAGLANAERSKYRKWADNSGTDWTKRPFQRELYSYDNVVDNLNVEVTNLAFEPSDEHADMMVAFSEMIRRRFQENAHPCSGHGLLAVQSLKGGNSTDTSFGCDCLEGWFGVECEMDASMTDSPTISPSTTPTTSPSATPSTTPSLSPSASPTLSPSLGAVVINDTTTSGNGMGKCQLCLQSILVVVWGIFMLA